MFMYVIAAAYPQFLEMERRLRQSQAQAARQAEEARRAALW